MQDLKKWVAALLISMLRVEAACLRFSIKKANQENVHALE